MATAHSLEYSKSSKAACHGPAPCKGTLIELGALRYGKVEFGKYGETVEWRHWGCVTPDILSTLATCKLERIPGWSKLLPADQNKIRMAVALKRIDPTDVPESAKKGAKVSATIASTQSGTQLKRKAAFDAPSSSQSGSSQPSSSQSGSRAAGTRTIVIDDDIEEIVPEEEVKDELYVMMSTNVVGVQYYKGLVGQGEEVRLIREPSNRYDANAIKVENIGRTQVGHIPRTIASKLAPLMDRGDVTVEGVMHEGNLTGHAYSLSMTLKIYGAANKRVELERKLIWATPGQRGFSARTGSGPAPVPGAPQRHQIPQPASYGSAYAGPSYGGAYGGSYGAGSSQRGVTVTKKLTPQQLAAQQAALKKQAEDMARAQELRQILNNLEKVDDQGRRSSLLDMLCPTDDLLALPEHPNPPGLAAGDLKVNLLKHQSQALQWCVEHEYPELPKKEGDKPVQFWQYRKAGGTAFYFNLATKTPQTLPPPLGRGALCADSMGLGKTLTMLALILTTKIDIPIDYSNTTLIVVPLSVLSNWEKQIQDHVKDGKLSYCIYYGTGRKMTPEQLKKYDVVITTYQTVVKEHDDSLTTRAGLEPTQKKRKTEKGMFDVKWKRVILDEGHSIRNPKTKMAKSVCALDAQRRWVLSGTPIINSPKDLGSILTFLQICRPLDNEDFFKRMVLRPLKDGDPNGAELMKAVMSHVCIRRTKEMQDSNGNPLVPLPPVEVTVVPVALTDEARELYDADEDISQQRVGNLIERHGGIGSAVVSVLTAFRMLTRLRQLALHPGLLPPNYLTQLRDAAENEVDAVPAPAKQLTAADKIRLQTILAQGIEDNEECPICFGILEDPRITSCSHMFCLACIAEVIARDPKCPMDRRPITMGDLVEPLPPTELTQAPVQRDEDDEDEDDDLASLRSGPSAKVEQLIHLLKLTPRTEKSLVFSQFTSFLDKIAESLEAAGIPYVRFDGKMSAKRRQETIARFSVPLEEDESPALTLTHAPAAFVAPPPPGGRASRSRRVTRTTTSESIVDLTSDDKDEDGDFVMSANEGDDDDFIDDSDSDAARWRKKKGKGKAKAAKKTKRRAPTPDADFDDDIISIPSQGYSRSDVNPKVMLISLKAGALGLNLTVANNVYLMDPWWQEGIESQAIDRCNRIGQTKPVHVYQLIAENTVESKVIDIQEKKKKLVEQAFSGIKSRETQRQKKEARLKDLVTLFGLRQTQAEQSSSQRTLDEFEA